MGERLCNEYPLIVRQRIDCNQTSEIGERDKNECCPFVY